MSTITKNKILNFLYATDRNVSLEKLSIWIENNTDGKYKIVNTDTQLIAQSNIELTEIAKKIA